MRIVLVHNHYGSGAPSGENQVLALERDLLVSRGHEVRMFVRHSDEILSQGLVGLVRGAVAAPWNLFMAHRMRELVADFSPHVVHAHNTFPLISPSVFAAARGSARVLTLHNYRLFCPAAIPMRQGRVCTECLERKSALPSIIHGCYRGSRLATLPLAVNVALQRVRQTWTRDVDAFIALSEFQRQHMTAAGLPAERVWVKPNFFPGIPEVVPWGKRRSQVVFAGRLSEEKGVDDLLTAWIAWGMHAPELVLLGSGPLHGALQQRVREAGVGNVRFVGQVDSSTAQRWIGESRLLVLPSRWFEGFPMVLREAFALGTPALVSDLGPLPELVRAGAGASYRAGDIGDLRLSLEALWGDPARLEGMAKSARAEFESKYTAEINYQTLMRIYARAMSFAGVSSGGSE